MISDKIKINNYVYEVEFLERGEIGGTIKVFRNGINTSLYFGTIENYNKEIENLKKLKPNK